MDRRKRVAAYLLAKEVLGGEWMVAQELATKRMRQKLSLDGLFLVIAAEPNTGSAPSTVERLLSSVSPVGSRNAFVGVVQIRLLHALLLRPC